MKRVAAGLVLLGVSFLAACASAGAAHADCSLRPIDSVFVGTAPVYRHCAVTRKAKLLTDRVAVDYRPDEQVRRSTCYSAEAMFVIDTLGRPETATARLLRQTNPEIGAAILNMLPKLRYQPALLDEHPVRQIATYKAAVGTFVVIKPSGSGPPSEEEARRAAPKC